MPTMTEACLTGPLSRLPTLDQAVHNSFTDIFEPAPSPRSLAICLLV